MNWSDLRNKLEAAHAKHLQRAMKASMALKAAEEALAELASLGHRFGLVEEPLEPAQEWPKMRYRTVGGSVESKVFASALEAAQAEGEWRDTPLALPDPPKGAPQPPVQFPIAPPPPVAPNA